MTNRRDPDKRLVAVWLSSGLREAWRAKLRRSGETMAQGLRRLIEQDVERG